MKSAPWFKFWASDYMMDRDVDDLPLEAQALLVRIWCVMWLEGGIPATTEEMARKCRVPVLHMQMHLQNLMQFFYTDASGLLKSERMEAERSKSRLTSKARSDSAKCRWNKDVNAFAYAKDDAKHNANGHAKPMQSESESESDKRKTKATAQAPFILPDDIPRDSWDGWIEMRKKIRSAPTHRAMEQAVKTLRGLRLQGHDSAKVLDQSTFNSWRGLFPVRELGDKSHSPSKSQYLDAAELRKEREARRAAEGQQ